MTPPYDDAAPEPEIRGRGDGGTDQVQVLPAVDVGVGHDEHGDEPGEEHEDSCAVRRLLYRDIHILCHDGVARVDERRAHLGHETHRRDQEGDPGAAQERPVARVICVIRSPRRHHPV